jgi:hypothetical protein
LDGVAFCTDGISAELIFSFGVSFFFPPNKENIFFKRPPPISLCLVDDLFVV